MICNNFIMCKVREIYDREISEAVAFFFFFDLG